MRCCFDTSEYTGTPDAAPCPQTLDVPAVVRGLDALYAAGRESEAQDYLERWQAKAREAGDWRAELSFTSELLGQYRRSMDAQKGLAAVDGALGLVKAHGLGRTVSGATVLLNAATTMKCFGRAEESLPVFRHVARVYADNLAPEDYRFAGLYNNMALSYADVGDTANAERHFRLAMQVISRCPNPENELAVTLCNLAELYDRQDPEDPRCAECMERAWENLNADGLPRDGYHAFTISKCAPSFDYFGYFLYSRELKERAEKIYAGS
jgi:tetratricopeptide (TPR) repeat protein